MNIVTDYSAINDEVINDIHKILYSKEIEYSDIILSEKLLDIDDNIIIPCVSNYNIFKSRSPNNNIKILKNRFYCDFILNNKNYQNYDVIPIDFNMPSNRKRNCILHINFNFFIRESKNFSNRLKLLLGVLSYYCEFNYKINPITVRSDDINIQILTPAQNDIYGVSITQIIMALQRNRVPMSEQLEESLSDLYIRFDYTIPDMISLLSNFSDCTPLSRLKNNFKTHDFSSLFE